jgi:hypothetical protein
MSDSAQGQAMLQRIADGEFLAQFALALALKEELGEQDLTVVTRH